MERTRRFTAFIITLVIIVSLCSCGQNDIQISELNITNCEKTTLETGKTLLLETDAPEGLKDDLLWIASSDSVTVNGTGLVTAVEEGTAAVTVSYKELRDTVIIYVVAPSKDKDDLNLSVDTEARDAFYGDSDPADSYEEALERSEKGILSGAEKVPDQAPVLALYMPMENEMYIRNNVPYFADENTYVVVNYRGEEVFRVYRGGGYITLEEVAAYVFAFGDIPANYVSSKKTDPKSSIWGENLRLNHSKFSGNTKKYPYEPELPEISGCGGNLQYYELDVGTTGTDCDPSYSIKTYNDGKRITRGAARIVYTACDVNGNDIIDINEKYLFYTYNHYNDFQEYLNYYGGWGEMFGNITGGGQLSSKSYYNPTPYVPVIYDDIRNYNEAA